MKPRTPLTVLACSVAALLAAGAGGALALDLKGLTDMEQLGALIFFDETLSIRQNQACASCHVPEVGWVGEDSEVNLGGSVYEGSRQNRLGNRKPPSSAYATESPVFGFNERTNRFEGGNFWDGRATGWTLGDPSAEQAQGPFLNPVEQALPDAACVVNRVCEGAYGDLFREVWRLEVPNICQIRWPANTFGQCNSPKGTVSLSLAHRQRVEEAYEKVARSISAFEASKASNAFTSKIDAFRTCVPGVGFTEGEARGQALFGGAGKCTTCHVGAPPRDCKLLPDEVVQPLFTDFAFWNLGVPKNPLNPMLNDDPDWFDRGLGGFLATVPAYADQAAANLGKHKTPTTRNVDLGACETAEPGDPCVEKAYMHNGFFKTLKQVVHFYNTRDDEKKARCEDLGLIDATVEVAMENNCWPKPEVKDNVVVVDPKDGNTVIVGKLGLSPEQEDDLVAFMKAMSDGYWVK